MAPGSGLSDRTGLGHVGTRQSSIVSPYFPHSYQSGWRGLYRWPDGCEKEKEMWAHACPTRNLPIPPQCGGGRGDNKNAYRVFQGREGKLCLSASLLHCDGGPAEAGVARGEGFLQPRGPSGCKTGLGFCGDDWLTSRGPQETCRSRFCALEDDDALAPLAQLIGDTTSMAT